MVFDDPRNVGEEPQVGMPKKETRNKKGETRKDRKI